MSIFFYSVENIFQAITGADGSMVTKNLQIERSRSMYQEEITVIGKGAAAKAALLRSNPLGYALSSMLAGMFIGLSLIHIW